jgi:exopolyphosphatase/guanosine-5'-triphosphate,3'-diphosphate pyrophosphatase
MSRRLAAIDIGTNSVLLVVAEWQPADGELRPLVERAEITRLGRGVDASGLLSAEGMDATLRVLEAYTAEAGRFGVPAEEITCVATSAARDARNGAAFLTRIETACGLRPKIIGGDREADLSYLAARREFANDQRPLLVQDIGGGSTELVLGTGEHPTFRRSLPIGSVRLFERWIHADPPSPPERAAVEREIEQAVGEMPVPGAFDFVGLAGTWTTLAAIACGSTTYDAAKVHGRVLTYEEIDSLTEMLWRSPLAERRTLPGLQPGRVDVIPIGASIASITMKVLGLGRVTVSDRGVRWGLLYERFAVQS